MGNQNNINYQNNNNVENQINNFNTVNNEFIFSQGGHKLPEVKTKTCPFWVSFIISGISVIADILSIRDMISCNPIKLLFRLENQNITEINLHICLPIIIFFVSLVPFAILYKLLCKKHFGRIIRKGNKLYFLLKVKCPDCKKATFIKLCNNMDNEQFTFTCKNCVNKYTYNFSELYNILN